MGEALSTLGFLRWAAIALYFALVAGALYWAFRRPASARSKAIAVVVAVALLGILPGNYALRAVEAARSRAEFEKYREAAWTHFKKRCQENAGEKIYRTVEDVEGIYLQRPREKPSEANLRDQYWLGDPYGLDYYGDAEIVAYLYPLNDSGVPTTAPGGGGSFAFVEMRQPNGRLYIRFVRSGTDQISREIVNTRSSRYGITWEDTSTAEDRRYWIAAGRLRVFDSATNALLGERVGHLMDSGFGSTSGARVPWLHARLNARQTACPALGSNAAINRLFVMKVLVPRKGADHGK